MNANRTFLAMKFLIEAPMNTIANINPDQEFPMVYE